MSDVTADWIWTAKQWNALHKSIMDAGKRGRSRLYNQREIRSLRSVPRLLGPVNETIDEEI